MSYKFKLLKRLQDLPESRRDDFMLDSYELFLFDPTRYSVLWISSLIFFYLKAWVVFYSVGIVLVVLWWLVFLWFVRLFRNKYF